MKILQINTLFAPHRYGGAEIFLEQLSQRLVGYGHEVVVACLSPQPAAQPPAPVRVEQLGLRNVYWPYDGAARPRWLKAVWHLRNSFGQGSSLDVDALLRRERPDLVHTHNLTGLTSAVWNTIRAAGIPLIHTLHDYALLCPTATMSRSEGACGAQCSPCRWLSWSKVGHSRAVDVVVGCSRFVLERHLDGGYFPQAARHVIHNGDSRDTSDAQPAAREAGAAVRIGYLGRLQKVKGLELMLDALCPLTEKGYELVVAGSGDPAYETFLRDRYAARGARFLGRVNAADFLARTDLLVVPSLWHEPCPLVVCEAIAAGVPVVAAGVGGIPEIVADGRCGLIFDFGDAGQLRACVERLAGDQPLRERMSQECREHAAALSFDLTARRYLELYQQTIN